MDSTPKHISTGTGSPVRQLIAAVRDELRERREARAAHRELVRELATYTTRSDVDDLLGVLRGREGAEVEEIRSLLLRNDIRHSQLAC